MQQQPPLHSVSPFGRGPATGALRHDHPPGFSTPAASAPAAATPAAIDLRTPAAAQSQPGPSHTQQPARGKRRSGSGSDDSSVSVAAVGARGADSPPMHKRHRADAAPHLPAAQNGQDGRDHTPPGQQARKASTEAAQGGKSASRESDRPQAAAQGLNSKQKAFLEVKALLGPLLEGHLVDREQYKAAAKAATHMLYRREGAAVRGPRQALGEVLSEMDLPRAAMAVLQSA